MQKSLFKTDYLFAQVSFLTGVGSILSLFSDYYEFNTAETSAQADAIAMVSDFGMVGNDLFAAINNE